MEGFIAATGLSTPATLFDRHGHSFNTKSLDFVSSINVRGSMILLPHMTKVGLESPDGGRGVVLLLSSSAA